MIKIYVKDGCPFCAAVLAKVDSLNLQIKEKNVSDPSAAEEMITLGGKRQQPFLYDEENDIKMYESSDIIDYLSEKYGDGIKGEEVEVPSGVCPI